MRSVVARFEGQAPRTLYRAFIVRGFTPEEAGDLAGVIVGLAPRHWTKRQIERLLTLRWEARQRTEPTSEASTGRL